MDTRPRTWWRPNPHPLQQPRPVPVQYRPQFYVMNGGLVPRYVQVPVPVQQYPVTPVQRYPTPPYLRQGLYTYPNLGRGYHPFHTIPVRKVTVRPGVISLDEDFIINFMASPGVDATTPLDELTGTLLNNKYKVIEFLGSGSYGNVYKVEDTKPSPVREWPAAPAIYEDGKVPKHYAIKVTKSGTDDVVKSAMKSAWREVRNLYAIFSQDTKCRMSHAVYMSRAFHRHNHMFMVYSLMGPSLAQVLSLNKRMGFTLSEVRVIGKQLACGLAFMHHLRLVHHDIKPDNIAFLHAEMEKDPKNPGRVKMTRLNIRILDFGSSGYPVEQTMGFKPATTRQYRSPEMTCLSKWDFVADVWSCAVVLYELYTGRRLINTCRQDWDLLFILEAMFGPFPDFFAKLLVRDRGAAFDTQGYLCRDLMNKVSKGWIRPSKFHHTLNTLAISRPECVKLMDLLGKAMVMNPDKRMTAKDMLAHPYLRSK